jgi:hypothetical protein
VKPVHAASYIFGQSRTSDEQARLARVYRMVAMPVNS